MARILVTSYINPDLDGVASAMAYAELLKIKGQNAEAIFFGKPQPEVDFFTQKCGYHLPIKSGEQKSRWESYVIVDTSSSKRLPKFIDPSKVIEIVDHHPAETGGEFPNARIQNEEVGATATLMWERSKNSGVLLSAEVARLIYAAIFHNTLNLLIGVSERDKKAIEDLEKRYSFKCVVVERMFNYLNRYCLEHLEEVTKDDLKEGEINGKQILGGQALVYGAKDSPDIRTRAVNLYQDTIIRGFLKLDDMKVNETALYTDDSGIKERLINGLGATFVGNWTTIKPLILRKKVFKILGS